MLLAQRVEDDDLVHPVQELGPEVAAHFLENGLFHSFVVRSLEPAAMFQNARAAHVAQDRPLDHTRVMPAELGHIAHLIGRFHGGGSDRISQTDGAANYSEK